MVTNAELSPKLTILLLLLDNNFNKLFYEEVFFVDVVADGVVLV